MILMHKLIKTYRKALFVDREVNLLINSMFRSYAHLSIIKTHGKFVYLPRPNEPDPYSESNHLYLTLLRLKDSLKMNVYFNRREAKKTVPLRSFSGLMIVPEDPSAAALDYMKYLSSFEYQSLIKLVEFSKIVKTAGLNLKSLSINELTGILIISAYFLPVNSWKPFVYAFLENVEIEMKRRMHQLTDTQILHICFLWFQLNKHIFNESAVLYLQENIFNLNQSDFILLSFILTNTNNRLLDKYKDNYQNKIFKLVDKLSIEELSIIAGAMFKSYQFITSPELLETFVDRFTKSVNKMDSRTSAVFLKLFRKCFGHSERDLRMCEKIQRSLYPQLQSSHYLMLTQAIILGSNVSVIDKKIFDFTKTKFMQNIDSIRLKDMEKFLFCLVTFNLELADKQFCIEKIISNVRSQKRERELTTFPESYLSLLYYLACLGYLPEDLIHGFLENCSSNTELLTQRAVQLQWIHVLLEVEGKYHTRDMLSAVLRTLQVVSPTHHENSTYCELFYEVSKVLKNCLGGERFIHKTSVLPVAVYPNLVFCLDKSGKPVEIPEEFFYYIPMEIKRPIGDLQWYCVMITPGRCFLGNSDELRGIYNLEKKIINKLDYKTCHTPATKLTREERFNFLHSHFAEEFSLKQIFTL